MEIVNFENKMSRMKNQRIKEAIAEMENCTNFILITSHDNCDSCEYVKFYVSNIESIGMLETTKHYILHAVIVEDDEPPSHEEDICAEGGK